LKLPLSQLSGHVEKKLARIYLIASDEPLLVAEATDQVRRAALAQGFDERKVHFIERAFRWEQLAGDGDNLSLFATRRIVEIRMAAPRPGDAGALALRALAESDDPDCLVIISIQARLDQNAQKSVWAKTIDRHGVIVDIRPPGRRELPRFIVERARQKGLAVDPDAAELLADRVEGNLLAADQELTKLALIVDNARVDVDNVPEAVASSARFDVFRLSDAVLGGDLKRALTVLSGLRTEGVAPALVLWAVAREISVLAQLKHAQARGGNFRALMSQLRIWQSRESLVRSALARYTDARLAGLLEEAARVDRVVKGVERAPVWEALIGLVIDLLTPSPARRSA
jgi:DNA polymerase-3 subunit delta